MTSARATNWIGPFLTERASAAAPVPRPPQPTSATRIVLSSAAWTHGVAAETIVVAAANRPVFLRNSRRVVSLTNGWFIDHLYRVGQAVQPDKLHERRSCLRPENMHPLVRLKA